MIVDAGNVLPRTITVMVFSRLHGVHFPPFLCVIRFNRCFRALFHRSFLCFAQQKVEQLLSFRCRERQLFCACLSPVFFIYEFYLTTREFSYTIDPSCFFSLYYNVSSSFPFIKCHRFFTVYGFGWVWGSSIHCHSLRIPVQCHPCDQRPYRIPQGFLLFLDYSVYRDFNCF